ncbi:30S ribosomal protein S1 [Geobacillus thermodenitrificans]|uniref:30S ribosomal protein S1 n=1 Tax=Geobacillus thermodenitrificans (strain NG80-2) TaxID=420246 RepID=A4IQA6_GEOTN|nr:30S ribosomal protein S1 [Geobacillus thermodenitrificans]ABO67510.1 30S ribosomal protein S1 [Geobacillus thermodenitrificans NG80-2]MEC5187613.1 small subunit ribosomal protein S1 [Geobacillus thermodenitrificans]MED0662314.1 30S ribosomal protein S1 [Geobacillus thermodenitrificans]
MTEEMNVQVNVYGVDDIVRGKVVKLEDKQVLVEVENSKQSGIIPISELSNLHIEKPSDAVAVGDEVTAKVKKVEEGKDGEEGLLILSKKAVDAERAWEELERKFASGETFETVVKDIVKGGLVADVGVRGFIPASLVEPHYVEDFSDYKGKTLTVKVVELDREKNRVILSHRAVVEEEQERQQKELLSRLEAGQVLDGVVRRIADFGVFVDVGGFDGLVHISQLSHTRVAHPSEVVKEGDAVKVKVLAVDPEQGRLSLSIKEALPGPWEGISEKVKPSDVVTGTVKRLASFGAFVEIFPGVEGLVHVSQIANRRIGSPHEVLKEGDEVKAKVLDVNEAEHRISLSIRALLEEETAAPAEDYSQYTKVAETRGFQLGEVIGEQLKKLK